MLNYNKKSISNGNLLKIESENHLTILTDQDYVQNILLNSIMTES